MSEKYLKALGLQVDFGDLVSPTEINDSIYAPRTAPYELWLKIGQSNSVGTDGSGPIDYFGEDAPHPKVLEVSRGTNRDYLAAPANELMIYKHPGQDDGSGIGFGQNFGKERVRLNDSIKELAIVNRGVGGTGFAGGRWNVGDDLYTAAVTQCNEFLEKHPRYKFMGFVWHQGESDAGNATNAAAYPTALADMVAGMRSEIFGADNAPFVCGTMVQSWIGNDVNRLAVDEIHRNISNYIPNSTFADFSEMTDFQDSIHFGTGSLREMGKIYARRHQELAAVMSDAMPIHHLRFDGGEVSDLAGGGRVYNPSFVYDAERGDVLLTTATGLKTDLVLNADAYTKACWMKREVAHSGFGNILSCSLISGLTDAHFWGISGVGHISTSGIQGSLAALISPVGTWDHFAVTYDGTQFEVYLNGVSIVVSTAQANALTQTLHGVEIGAFGGSNGIAARFDDIVILPYAASAAAIANLAAN